MDLDFISSTFGTTVRMFTPILLASLGGAFTYHAGIINVALEGLMLSSAFFSVVFSFITGSAIMGVLGGILAAVILSIIYSFFVSILKANNFAIGFALNILVSSLTLYLMRIMFVGQNAFNSPKISSINTLAIKTGNFFLDNFVFNFSLLTYISIILVFVCVYVIYKTSFGLRMRVSGESQEALRTAGVKVGLIQFLSSIICGVFCGLAGAQLSLFNVRMFSRDMTGGRGFVALAAILIARGKPKLILIISFLFGLFDALSIKLQNENFPPQFALMLPYVMSILVLFLFYLRARTKEHVKKKQEYDSLT
jgi:simple sugar transport system permease protein